MTQETRRDLRFRMFAGALVVLASVAASVAFFSQVRGTAGLSSWDGRALALYAVLLVAAATSEYMDVAIPGSGYLSLSQPIGIAISVCFGPFYAFLSTLVANLSDFLRPGDRTLSARVANVGMLVVTDTLPGLVLIALGGVPLYPALHSNQATPALWMLALAGLGSPIANLALGAIGVSIMTGASLLQTWKTKIAWMLGPQVALSAVGLAMAQIVATIEIPGVALFVVPLLVARQTYERTVKLREAYADTIASLVGALEAKDVYTKGHSVRVAKYATAIARAMEIPDDLVGRLEWAALLHDIGKVGISRRILSKTDRLSSDEYTEIKRHPEIGARILAAVPYLADLVPSIEAHHERLDGTGYGRGARGDDIPLEARVLAVADAYDAMTSTRPYRDAMTHEAAMAELTRCRGTQFDERVVDAFASAAIDSSLFADEGVAP